MDARPALGQAGEDIACRHLAAAGMVVLARNWRLATGELRGELDVVALDPHGGTLVVCEVKTRRGRGFGGPLAAVTAAKQAKIRALTLAFVRQTGLRYARLRFDVVAVVIGPGRRRDVQHVEAAF